MEVTNIPEGFVLVSCEDGVEFTVGLENMRQKLDEQIRAEVKEEFQRHAVTLSVPRGTGQWGHMQSAFITFK